MKGKAFIPLILGLGIGLLAIKFGMDTLKNAKGEPVETDARYVVRAVQDIDAMLGISREMLELVETADPAQGPESDRDFEAFEDVEGRVALKFIPRGTAVRGSMLAPPGTAPGVPGKIEPGYRAVSLRIDEVSGVAFNVHPGAWVDVIVVMDVVDPNTHKRETIAEVVLQHIQVAAVGLSSTGEEPGSRNKIARSATLLVPEEDVPKLHLAAVKGKVTLAMRGDNDAAFTELYAARDSELFGSLGSADVEVPEPQAPKGPDLGKLMEMMMAAQANAAGGEEPPFTMMIARGRGVPGAETTVERITYENANSWKILAVTEGLPTRQSMAMSAQPKGVVMNPALARRYGEMAEDEQGGEPTGGQPDMSQENPE